MKNRKLWCTVVIGVLVVAAAAVPAKADTIVVYDNGPLNGNVQAYSINSGFSVSDSFQPLLDGFTKLTGATIGLWVLHGYKPLTLDWSLGTSFFGSDVASGTTSLTRKFDFTNGSGYDVYTVAFSFGDLGYMNQGTYYLTLQNATSGHGNPVYWDQNSGPSQAMDSSLGSVPSETFQIIGDRIGDEQTPEPASLILLGTGLAGLAGGIRKRMKAS
jgi:hypothetical protein